MADLQWERFPLLYTNVAIPPSNIWHEYTSSVFFDYETGLALLYIASEDRDLGQDAVESAKGSLTYIARVNANNNCGGNGEANVFFREAQDLPDYNKSDSVQYEELTRCYIPVLFFNDDKNTGLFPSFLKEIIEFDFPPALIMDLNGDAPEYKEATRVGPDLYTWVVSYRLTKDNYFDQRITTSNETLEIVDLEITFCDLTTIPTEVADEEYQYGLDTFAFLGNYTTMDAAVGESSKMPASIADSGYRHCYAGECAIGNFFTDAIRWHMKSDVAFLPSILFAGDGWDAGVVFESSLYESLPQINYVCNGTMNGVSLFELIHYSINQANFTGRVTRTAGELLQVSGMRITYNPELEDNKLVAIDVYDETTKDYKPMDPTALYTFATDSYVCKLYADFPKYTTTALTAEGEQPGEFTWESNQVVAELYMTLLGKPYNATREGRLQEVRGMTQSFNLVSTKSDCINSVTYWEPDYSACFYCPTYSNVTWRNDSLEIKGQSGSSNISAGFGYLVNNEKYPVKVTPKIDTFPDNANYSFSVNGKNVGTASMTLQSGDSVTVEFDFVPTSMAEGLTQSNVLFGIESGGEQPGCVGPDSVLNLLMRVTPPEDMNQIGNLRYIGFVLFFIILATSLWFGVWVYRHAKLRVVTAMQPIFLYAICFGIIILAVTIICLSIDDSLISPEGCSQNCVATYWFLSLGFCISVSALFSKLWRINKLFSQQQFRRVQVRERDVILPFAILFTLNFAFLLTWTVADPLRWVRIPVDGRPSNTYGICASSGPVGLSMMLLIGFVNFTALGITCWQAYLARNINSDFSEAKYLGIGLFSWAQVALVGLPVLFLLDQDNPTARFFLLSALIFVVSISMMVIIFVPMILTTRQANAKGSSVRISGMGASSTKDSGSTGSNSSLGGGGGSVRISGLDSGSGATTYTTSQYKSAASSTASHFESIQEAPETSDHDEQYDEAKDADASNEEDCLVEPDADEYNMDHVHDVDDDEETRVLNATVDTADDVDSGATSSEASHELP